MSYLSRHRTICSVLCEIADIAEREGNEDIVKLCAEALRYARSMSNKLTEYKLKEEKENVERLANAES